LLENLAPNVQDHFNRRGLDVSLIECIAKYNSVIVIKNYL
jgi:hypothetical protein